jgi:hypothetical protein
MLAAEFYSHCNQVVYVTDPQWINMNGIPFQSSPGKPVYWKLRRIFHRGVFQVFMSVKYRLWVVTNILEELLSSAQKMEAAVILKLQ